MLDSILTQTDENTDGERTSTKLVTLAPEEAQLSPQQRAELNYQRELAKHAPGSGMFRMLKKARRSMRVYQLHAAYWPTERSARRGYQPRTR